MVKQRNSERIRSCPFCGSNAREVLHSQQFAAEGEHRIVTCMSCSFVYVGNTPSQTHYNAYYRDTSHYEIERDYNYHQKYARIIAKFFPKSGRILDIGCATGHVLYLLKKRGFTHVTGLDPSPTCKRIAKEQYGINIFAADLYNFSPKRRYDGVILAAVLEHLDDVRGAISNIWDMLSDHGLLFLAVPDAGRFWKKFDEPFGEFSTEHINFFSESSLYRFLPKFTCLSMESDGGAIYSVWEKGSDVQNSVTRYISKSQTKMRNIKKVIDALPDKVLVWGAGSLTQRLLMTTDLGKKVVKFIDKSDKLIGSKFQGIDVISPDAISGYKEPILISSYRFKKEILQWVRSNHIPNRVYTFS